MKKLKTVTGALVAVCLLLSNAAQAGTWKDIADYIAKKTPKPTQEQIIATTEIVACVSALPVCEALLGASALLACGPPPETIIKCQTDSPVTVQNNTGGAITFYFVDMSLPPQEDPLCVSQSNQTCTANQGTSSANCSSAQIASDEPCGANQALADGNCSATGSTCTSGCPSKCQQTCMTSGSANCMSECENTCKNNCSSTQNTCEAMALTTYNNCVAPAAATFQACSAAATTAYSSCTAQIPTRCLETDAQRPQLDPNSTLALGTSATFQLNAVNVSGGEQYAILYAPANASGTATGPHKELAFATSCNSTGSGTSQNLTLSP